MEEKIYKNFEIDIQACWDLVEEGSDHNKYYRREYPEGFSQPPLKFLKESGIDVSGHYNLGGLKIQDIQLLCYASHASKSYLNLAYLIRDLSKIDPSINILVNMLRSLEYDLDDLDIYHIGMGIASLYNIDDIIFFIKDYKGGYDNHVKKDSISRMYNLLSIYKPNINWYHNIEWVISPATAETISEKVISILEF